MSSLLVVLTSIGLLDSVSITPLASVPLLALLGSRRPLANSVALISGILVPYLAFGVLALLGLDSILDYLAPHVDRFVYDPQRIDGAIEIALGLVMIFFGFKLGATRENEDDKGADSEIGPGAAFSIGFALTFVGLPGALPYFAAIDQLLRADLSLAATLLALLYYNVICSVPLVAIVVARAIFGERAEPFFRWIAAFLARWSHRLIVVGLMLLGFALLVDGSFLASGHALITYERPDPGA